MKTHVEVAAYIHRSIRLSGKTNLEIAEESGFSKGNFISMLRHGHSELPITRAHVLARAMGTEPAVLFEGCLAAYYPDLHKEFEMLAPSMIISKREFDVIDALRRAGYFT